MRNPATPDRKFYRRVTSCTRCPRLVEWREQVAEQKVKRFSGWEYWGKPVPSFGDLDAEFIIVGLAPAAHGANRTGRMFTGDRSGDWLYEALHTYGFASQPDSEHADDGLELINTRITAVAHCAPPQNKLLREEIDACTDYLSEELELLEKKKIVMCLGTLAYTEVSKLLPPADPPKPKFSHGCSYTEAGGVEVIGSYHPSQQNTFTGRLTKDAWHAVFAEVQRRLQ